MDRQEFNGVIFIKDSKGYYRAENNFTLFMHRYVWEFYNTEIPEGYEIHHKDLNRGNNNIENLCLLSCSEHKKLHGELLTEEQKNRMRENLDQNARPKASEWHKSEEGSKWHTEHIRRQRDSGAFNKALTCTNCGKLFIGEVKGENTFCCNACKSAYRRKSGKNNVERICVCCGKTFITDKYKHSKTCSRSCANVMWHREKRRGN